MMYQLRHMWDTIYKRVTALSWIVIFRTGTYLAAQFIQRAANLILLPLLITQMSAEQFSRYGLLSTLFLIIGAIFTLNIHLAPARLIFDSDVPQKRADLLFTSLTGMLLMFAAWSVVVLIALQGSNIQDPVTQGNFFVQLAVLLCVAALRISDFGTVLMQVEGKAALFATTAVVRQMGLLGAFYGLSYLLTDAFIAFVLAFLVSSIAAMSVSLRYVWQRIRQGRFQKTWFYQSLDYAAPTAIHLIAIWFIQSSGRWIGTRYMTLEELAPYTLITQIVLIVTMFSRAFFSARAPEIGAAFGAHELQKGMRVINSTVILTLPFLLLGYVALYILTYVLQVDLPLDYRPTILLMAFAVVINIFDLIYLRGIQTLGGLKKNHAQAIATVFSGIVTILISFPLAAAFSDIGLIIAMTLGYGVQAISSNLMAQYQLKKAHQADSSPTTPA